MMKIRVRMSIQTDCHHQMCVCVFHVGCVCFKNVVFFSVGDDPRGGSPGAQRLQEETRLCAGDIRGFARGKL